jgi:hypothetical protein
VKGRGDILLFAVAVAIVVVLSLANSRQEEQPSLYSSYDTGRNGYRALYEVLRRERVATGRFEEELGNLHHFAGTMILSANAADGITIDPPDAARLALLVRGGARLVVLGEPDDVLAKALSLPATREIAAVSLARAISGPFTQSVRRVGANVTAVFREKREVRALLIARGAAAAIFYALGRGTVIAVSAPDVFSNSNLASNQNAWFAYDVLSGATPVLFDERLHGYAQGNSMWEVLPSTVRGAVWIALAILLLAVFGGIFRSAPPVTLEPVRQRDSSAYLAAMASLLRRSRAGGAAVARFAGDAQRLARQRRSLAARADIVAELETLEAMREIVRPNDAIVLSAARAYAYVRREFVG